MGALSDDSGQFATVTPGRVMSFPRDHGEHPEFKTEWWYVTGNLKDEAGAAYGYQLTFFSSGLPSVVPAADSPWNASRIMMAHLAVSDPSGSQFHSFERFSRCAMDLAGVRAHEEGLTVWLEDWRLSRGRDGTWKVQATQGEVSLDLSLVEKKPPVLQGEKGYSRKGPASEDASYYVSLTRLETTGSLRVEGKTHKVAGSSWFDHEWSSQPLAPGLVGWDWFSLQLDDGWELMLFTLRYPDGSLDPNTSGTLVDPNGASRHLSHSEFEILVTERYRSARGVDYPCAWRVRVPSAGLEVEVTPRMRDQEMTSSVPYWEGAVVISGTRDGKDSRGVGFVEMTGYDKS